MPLFPLPVRCESLVGCAAGFNQRQAWYSKQQVGAAPNMWCCFMVVDTSTSIFYIFLKIFNFFCLNQNAPIWQNELQSADVLLEQSYC